MLSTRKTVCGIALAAVAAAWVSTTMAQEVKHYRFAYDQPKTTGYGIAGDLFADKLKELSKGTMLIDQYPGAQLGQEPQVLQLIKAGDVEFCISSSANAATLTPQAGVMSLHFLFRGEDHLVKALADPQVTKAVKDMVEDTVQGAHALSDTPAGAGMTNQIVRVKATTTAVGSSLGKSRFRMGGIVKRYTRSVADNMFLDPWHWRIASQSKFCCYWSGDRCIGALRDLGCASQNGDVKICLLLWVDLRVKPLGPPMSATGT